MHSVQKNVILARLSLVLGLSVSLLGVSGCHDGPMFALKQANPFYSMGQWKADQRLGPTDAKRAAELRKLVASIGSMSPEDQQTWVDQMAKIMEYDQSPYMRELAVRAAARANSPNAIAVIETGLDDDEFKIRMVAADSLAKRPEPKAVELLAKTVSSESNKDVRLAAIKSLGTHQGQQATDALKLALEEPDLAYRYATIASLRSVTGKDAGNEPAAWVAMLDSDANAGNGSTDDKSDSTNLLNKFF